MTELSHARPEDCACQVGAALVHRDDPVPFGHGQLLGWQAMLQDPGAVHESRHRTVARFDRCGDIAQRSFIRDVAGVGLHARRAHHFVRPGAGQIQHDELVAATRQVLDACGTDAA